MDTFIPPLPSTAVLARLRRRPAPPAWLLARSAHEPAGRASLVARCRAELECARAQWLELAAGLGIAVDPWRAAQHGSPPWEAAHLPREQAAARLLNAWGHLHPTEALLRRLIPRLRAQRANAAHGDWAERAAGTLADLQWHRRERRRRWSAFLAAAADYYAKAGWTVAASARPRQKARIVSNLDRKAS